MPVIELTASPFDPAEALATFCAPLKHAGGVVSFHGRVRGEADGKTITALTLQIYDPLTRQGIETAVDQARTKWPLEAVTVIHRYGEMRPGDAIVFVATASTHRRAAFEAADYLMDYLKTEAIFWKKESRTSGEVWIEPRDADYDDASRWR